VASEASDTLAPLSAHAEASRRKILVLMSDTGGGHRASAQALSRAMESLYPGRWECEILDIWTDYAAWPYKNFVSYYQYVAKRPMLWRALWLWGKFPLTRFAQERHCAYLNYRRFEACLRERVEEGLDAVVSVHPLCQTLPLKILDKLGRREDIPFVTVVTDLASAHPTWFHRAVDKCFVPSDSVYGIAKRCGLPDDKLELRGLPLREPFWRRESRPKEQVRRELDLPQDKPTVLVVGGGDGVGGIAKVAKSIAAELGDREASLVVVCGKNDVARADLEAHDWPGRVAVSVVGFVSNMDEYMAAADCIVTKAGPGTIAEAATRGLPTLLSSYLPGQEAGNVKFVTKQHKFGTFKRRPKKIAATVRDWFDDDASRQQMADHAVKAAKLHATTDIARDIANIISQHKLLRTLDPA